MKNWKQALLAIIAIFGIIIGFTACDNNDTNHNHDFSGEWQKDATDHWKVCTADSTVGQKAKHTLAGGVCTECGYFYSIGDTGPAGGIIFYVSDGSFTMTGIAGTCHYLEVSPANLTGGTGSEATMKWSTATGSLYPDTNGTLETIGSGKNNTAIIIAAESVSYPGNTYVYAARACSEYSGGGKDDWFLPSKDELNELYKATEKTGIPTTVYFWSSSQYGNDVAWIQNFADGSQYNIYKNYERSVRAVRAF